MRKVLPFLSFWVVFTFFRGVGADSGLAAKEACAQITKSTAAVFLQELDTSYRPLMCSDNVLALKTSLETAGVSLTNAHVVVLRHKAVPYIGISPLMARLTFKDKVYKSPTWMFHVFLVVDGLVFDMDYTDEPKTIGLESYMLSMWDQDQLKDYDAQTKPLDQYSKKDVFGVFADEAVLSASELMTFFNNTSCFARPALVLQHDSI